MTELKVIFRGLFTLARHTAPPAPGQTIRTDAEPMTAVFPVDHGMGMRASGGHHDAEHRQHVPLLIVPAGAVTEPARGLAPTTILEVAGHNVYDISNKILNLPRNAAKCQEPVRHQDEEVFDHREPTPHDVECVGACADWRSLSRLPSLNALTGQRLAIDLARPDKTRVDSMVRFSGGHLRSVRSYKHLADAFFEFFDAKGTVLIQPAVEEIEYTLEVDGPAVEIATSPIDDPEHTSPGVIVIDPKRPVVIQSLPISPTPAMSNLNHFLNFYPLMDEPRRQPFLRVLGRRDDDGCLVHTMPAANKFAHACENGMNTYPLDPIFRTNGACSCLASQAFVD